MSFKVQVAQLQQWSTQGQFHLLFPWGTMSWFARAILILACDPSVINSSLF